MNLTPSGWLIFILIAMSSAMLYFNTKIAVSTFILAVVLDWLFDNMPPSSCTSNFNT